MFYLLYKKILKKKTCNDLILKEVQENLFIQKYCIKNIN